MALSLEFRKRIVKAYDNGEGSLSKLSKRFCVGTNTIFILLRQYEARGELKAKSPPGRNRKINVKEEKLLREILKSNSDLTLEELCEAFSKKSGIRVSVPTMYRACERINITYKKNAISRRAKAR